MRKILLSVICLITFLYQVNAQQESKKFNFGLKVAPAISWLNVNQSDISGNGAKMKFNWGFVGAWNFYDNFSFVSGFNINSLGGNYKTISETNKIRYSEFQLPLIFQMRSNPIGNMRLHAQLGLAEGVMLSAKDKDDKKINKEVRSFNTVFLVAGGAEFKVAGEISLLGQIKYNGGLTKISKKYNIKNNFIELAIGVLF